METEPSAGLIESSVITVWYSMQFQGWGIPMPLHMPLIILLGGAGVLCRTAGLPLNCGRIRFWLSMLLQSTTKVLQYYCIQ
jgi:hypothetical protein